MGSHFAPTADERVVIDAVRNGEETQFQDATAPVVIRAELIRRLLLGLDILTPAGEPHIVPVQGPGIRIANSLIEGQLDLSYGCMRGGEPMPRLSLENCLISQPIQLKGARIRRICLKASRIDGLCADRAHIAGHLDLRYITSAKTHTGAANRGRCFVSIRGAHIEDGVDAAGACLVSSLKRPDYKVYDKRARYAFDAVEARIDGGLRLFPDFEACGGVSLNSAEIDGSVSLHGARVSMEEMYALDITGAHITGKLAMGARLGKPGHDTHLFVCDGDIHLRAARIGNGIRMWGAQVNGIINATHIQVNGGIDLRALAGQSQGNPKLFPFDCEGKVDLRAAQINGDLLLRGAHLRLGLDASTSKVNGFVRLTADTIYYADRAPDIMPFRSEGLIELGGAHIGDDLDMRGAYLKQGLRARAMKVTGQAYLNTYIPDDDNRFFERFRSIGDIYLTNAVIGLDLDMSSAELEQTLFAQNLRVGGHLLLCEDKQLSDIRPTSAADAYFFSAKERVSLSGAIIQSDCNLMGARLRRGARLRGLKVESALRLDVRGGEPFDPKRRTHLRKGDRLRPSSIDLTHATVGILDDMSDDEFRYSDCFIVRPEGFSYGRFTLKDLDEESKVSSEADKPRHRQKATGGEHRMGWASAAGKPPGHQKATGWEHRKDWLSLQYLEARVEGFDPSGKPLYKYKKSRPKRDTYSADTYNMMFKVLKKNGWTQDAEDIIIQKNIIESYLSLFPSKFHYSLPFLYPLRLLLAVMRLSYALLFGYGLKPIRSTLVFFACFALLYAGVSVARSGTIGLDIHETSTWLKPSPEESGEVKQGDKLQISHRIADPALYYLPQQAQTVLLPGAEGSMDTRDYLRLEGDSPVSSKSGGLKRNLLCGDRIQPAIFALEMMIPGADFNQREKCDFTTQSGTGWLIFKTIGTLLGWLITSLTLLTWSGLFRRHVEPDA